MSNQLKPCQQPQAHPARCGCEQSGTEQVSSAWLAQLRSEYRQAGEACKVLRESMQMDALTIEAKDARIAEQSRELERLNIDLRNEKTRLTGMTYQRNGLQEEVATLKAQPPGAGVAQGIDIDAAAKALAQCMDYPWGFMPEQGREAMREHAKSVIGAARLNVSAVAVLDGLQPEIERAAKFVEVVRECERLASSFCGSIDGVDEHGGDDHEDPTCAIWHRLYYAMFDGDKVVAKLRQIAAPSTQQIEC